MPATEDLPLQAVSSVRRFQLYDATGSKERVLRRGKRVNGREPTSFCKGCKETNDGARI
jgi:hypothetical protein